MRYRRGGREKSWGILWQTPPVMSLVLRSYAVRYISLANGLDLRKLPTYLSVCVYRVSTLFFLALLCASKPQLLSLIKLHGAVVLEKITGHSASEEVICLYWKPEVHYKRRFSESLCNISFITVGSY